MSRYLTSTKVGLLVLTWLYTESVVPTSATIPVLSFIIKHTLRKRGTTDVHSSSDSSTGTSIAELQAATISLPSGIPGRTLWDLFLKKLWAIDSLDALYVFFDSLDGLLAQTREQLQDRAETEEDREADAIRLARTSPIGIFVRRAQLEFTRLPLHDVISLWKSLVVFREPTLASWRRRNPSAARNSFDHNSRAHYGDAAERILYSDLADFPLGPGKATTSTEDAERLLEFQIDRLQKLGQRIDTEMKEKIQQMLSAASTVSSLSYYINFLDAWKGGNFTLAFDSLHRYFDYTMHIQGRTFYQYALVNMAIMQADFGCNTEALVAMHESIAMARENKDMGCLNFCLSWLYHFSTLHPWEVDQSQRKSPLGADKEALSFIKSKAKESSMWSLLSTTLLGEAGLTLANGESAAVALENVVRSSYLNNIKNVAVAHGNQMIVESSLYSRLGLNYMQWSRGEVYLQCYSRKSLSEDVVKFVCIQALILARRGRYHQAMTLIGDVDGGALRTLRYQQAWLAYVGLLKTSYSIRHNDLNAAQVYSQQLDQTPPKDHTLSFASFLLKVELLIRRRQLMEAMSTVESFIADAVAAHMDTHAKVKLIVLKSRIFAESGNAEKGFSIAVRAASLAYKCRILDVLWEAVVVLCRVLCSLSEYSAAAALMRSAIPHILEVEDCELSGAAFSIIADAYMGLAGQAMRASTKRREHSTKALGYLERAFDEFSRIEEVSRQAELMAKRSVIMQFTGDTVLANDYAAKYLSICHEFEPASGPGQV